MVFIHVIRGRPSGLLQFPAGDAVKICFESVSSGIRAMCPNRDRRLDWTMAERWGCLVNLLTLSLHTGWAKNTEPFLSVDNLAISQYLLFHED